MVKTLTCILIKNWFQTVYLKQINVLTQTVISVAVDCKSDSRQGIRKQQWFIKVNRRNIQSMQHAECAMLTVSAKILAGERCDFSWPYVRLSAPHHHSSSTDDSSNAKEQKLTKQCFLPFPHRFSTKGSQYQYWKASKYSIPRVIEFEPPVSESSTGSQNFMASLILNTNFIKRESNIGYP